MTQYPSVGSPMFYGIFFIAVLIMIAIDMVSLKKNGAHKVSIKEALAWSGIWVAVSCAFAGWLYFELAGNPAYEALKTPSCLNRTFPRTSWLAVVVRPSPAYARSKPSGGAGASFY